MSPSRLTGDLVTKVPLLRAEDTVETAVRALLASGMPALPAVREGDELAGIFGEREFFIAVFPR